MVKRGLAARLYLESKNFGLEETERFAVDFDETFTCLEFQESVERSCSLYSWCRCRCIRTLQWATAVATRCQSQTMLYYQY